MRKIKFGTSINTYMEEYAAYIFCPQGTVKMQQNAVTKSSRAKVLVKFLCLGCPSLQLWDWRFLFNVPLLKFYPTLLRNVGLAPTTVALYLGQAISFMEFFRDTPPKHSRLKGGEQTLLIREIRKLYRDVGRNLLGHQLLVKQTKQQRLVSKEDLIACQSLAKMKMSKLLEDIANAPPRDPKTRYRFFGYLAAYLSSIYGHRSGVLTKMRAKEVREAVGEPKAGYLINVLDHKTVRKFGVAQIYLEPEEHSWCVEWLRLHKRSVPTNGYFFSSLGRGEAKDIVKYFRAAWAEMGLHGTPSLMDMRSAVSTYNFESNDAEVRDQVATFMCHSVKTQERFYALHNTLKRAKQMRELFVSLSLRRGEAALSSASADLAIPVEESEGVTPQKKRATSQLLARKIKGKLGISPRKKYPLRIDKESCRSGRFGAPHPGRPAGGKGRGASAGGRLSPIGPGTPFLQLLPPTTLGIIN
nr:uncharacterized protein LOC122764505 [Solea senegalensis]